MASFSSDSNLSKSDTNSLLHLLIDPLFSIRVSLLTHQGKEDIPGLL